MESSSKMNEEIIEKMVEEYIKKNLKLTVKCEQENFKSNCYVTVELKLKDEVLSQEDFTVYI